MNKAGGPMTTQLTNPADVMPANGFEIAHRLEGPGSPPVRCSEQSASRRPSNRRDCSPPERHGHQGWHRSCKDFGSLGSCGYEPGSCRRRRRPGGSDAGGEVEDAHYASSVQRTFAGGQGRRCAILPAPGWRVMPRHGDACDCKKILAKWALFSFCWLAEYPSMGPHCSVEDCWPEVLALVTIRFAAARYP